MAPSVAPIGRATSRPGPRHHHRAFARRRDRTVPCSGPSPNPTAAEPDGRRVLSRGGGVDHAVTPQAPLTGSGCREHSYGGFGRLSHFHPHGCPARNPGIKRPTHRCRKSSEFAQVSAWPGSLRPPRCAKIRCHPMALLPCCCLATYPAVPSMVASSSRTSGGAWRLAAVPAHGGVSDSPCLLLRQRPTTRTPLPRIITLPTPTPADLPLTALANGTGDVHPIL